MFGRKKHDGDDDEPPRQSKQDGLAFIDRHKQFTEEIARLEPAGVRAPAVVSSCELIDTLQITGNAQYSMRATVDPPEGDAFEATIPLYTFGASVKPPAPGETINVLFDPADTSMVRPTMMWRQSAASQIAAARWQVPAECPECGARIDQSAAETAAHPTCPFCQQPLPVTPIA